MKKRLISLILVFCMLFSMVPASAIAAGAEDEAAKELLINPFTDVKEDAWYFTSVQYVRMNGIFNGTTAETFDPNGTMTRGMFVTVLGRMAGVVTDDYAGVSDFTDVSPDAYYAPYVAWAAKHGITTGTSETTFSPAALITRQQMATFFVRYFDTFGIELEVEEEVTSVPADIDSAAPYAQEAILQLWKTGLLNGDGENFNPSGYASRAQTATLCYRADEVVKEWYREPGVKSDRVRIDPETGKPYEPQVVICSVRFYDDTRLIDTLYAIWGQPLGRVPDVEKSSKADGILLGYYLDPEFTEPFYAEEPVVSNMKIYAKYQEMDPIEELNITTFTQIDLTEDPVFEIVWTGEGVADPTTAASLNTVDGTEVIELAIAESGDGVYTVSGDYEEGSSYELTLAEGWIFKDKPETIRTASFSLDKAEVANLAMSDDIVYIQDKKDDNDTAADISFTINGTTHDVLSSRVPLTDDAGAPYTGTINGYTAPEGLLAAGDIICIYQGVHPAERPALSIDDDPDNDAALLDPAVYVKVKAVANDGTVSFEAMGEGDQLGLYDVPDNFPFYINAEAFAALTETGTVDINGLDVSMYETAIGKENGTLAGAKEKMSVGDFVTFYYDLTAETPALYYGRVTEVNGDILSYTVTTEEAIVSSMDMYSNIALDGSVLVTDAEKQELETLLLQQVSDSSFPEEAAQLLAEMVVETDNFRNNPGVQELLTMGLDEDELSTMALDPDAIKVDLELITSGNKLHFKGGTQLALSMEVEFEIEAEDGSVNVDLTADFIEEVALAPKAKGELTYKKILGIPFPNGVEVSASVDIKNYTAFSFQADVYTTTAKEDTILEKFKNAKFDEMGLPESLVSGIETVKDAIDKAEELQAEIDRAAAAPATIKQYQKDVANLWKAISNNEGGISKAEWDAFCSLTNMTSITSELLGVMDDAEAEGVTDNYKDTLEALMQRYSDTMSRETDWVQLLEKEIFTAEVSVCGLCIGVEATFVIRADINISIGSSLEYEVGKRYSFWFRIGLYAPTAGSETMDLIDEHFAFQFYVMGKLGIKMGVAAQLYVAIGTKSLASVGIRAEMGPYLKLYGFFVYEYDKYRPKNTQDWTYNERMAGALYLEFGLYFMLSFEAEALEMFSYSHNFLDEEIPLLTAGERKYYYRNEYVPQPDEYVIVRDVDADSTNGITMELPEVLRSVAFVDLVTGQLGSDIMDLDKFNITVSNPNFSIDENGIINVDVPRNVRFMECDVTITYLHGKLAFSDYDMSVTVPLAWTNLATSELKEFFNVSVRVGEGADRFTVWYDRYLKGQEYTLPSVKEIAELLGINLTDDSKNLRYSLGDGYGSQLTTDTTIENKAYDFDIDFKEYTITVNGVENPDGSKTTKTFTAQYGDVFNLSSLESTGTNDTENGVYTKFANVTAKIGDKEVDLREPIDDTLAKAINAGKLTVTANYMDDSVQAVFSFSGLTHEDEIITLRRGEVPSTASVAAIVEGSGENMAIKGISPAIGAIDTATHYTVDCVTLEGKRADIVFNYERASTDEETVVDDPMRMDKLVGSLIVNLPRPARIGYEFDGWFDIPKTEGVTRIPAERLTVPEAPEGETKGIDLYANWTPKTYTITYDINIGDSLCSDVTSKTVTYDQPYGELPFPDGGTEYGFVGWFTEPYGDVMVTEDTIVQNSTLPRYTEGANEKGDPSYADPAYAPANEPLVLYARWKTLIQIPDTAIVFGSEETKVYDGQPLGATYTYGEATENSYIVYPDKTKSEEVYETLAYPNPLADDSTYVFKYKRDDSGVDFEPGLPYNAGYYGVTVQRARDNNFKSFDHYYTGDFDHNSPPEEPANLPGTGVVRINKASGSFNVAPSVMQRVGSGIVANPITSGYTGDGQIQFAVSTSSTRAPGDDANWTSGVIGGLAGSTTYYLWARLSPGMNYTDDPIPVVGDSFTTGSMPSVSWRLDVKTGTDNNAGTDATIKATFGGTTTNLDNDGNDHENGALGKYSVGMGSGLPQSNGDIPMVLYFGDNGGAFAAAGWQLDFLELHFLESGSVIKSSKLAVDKWFEDAGNTNFTFTGFKRGLSMSKYLDKVDGSSVYIDSSISDNLKSNYNPYSRPNSPKLWATFAGSHPLDAIFDAYLYASDLYTISIDRSGLRRAMEEYRIAELTLYYGVDFNNDSFKNIYRADNVDTQTMTIKLSDLR